MTGIPSWWPSVIFWEAIYPPCRECEAIYRSLAQISPGFKSCNGLYVQMVSQSMLALAGFLRDLRFPPAFKLGALYCMLCWCLDPFRNKSHDTGLFSWSSWRHFMEIIALSMHSIDERDLVAMRAPIQRDKGDNLPGCPTTRILGVCVNKMIMIINITLILLDILGMLLDHLRCFFLVQFGSCFGRLKEWLLLLLNGLLTRFLQLLKNGKDINKVY